MLQSASVAKCNNVSIIAYNVASAKFNFKLGYRPTHPQTHGQVGFTAKNHNTVMVGRHRHINATYHHHAVILPLAGSRISGL